MVVSNMYINALNVELGVSSSSANTITARAPGIVTGTNKNDIIYGMAGSAMSGGLGDDKYYVYSSNFTINEAAGEGIDTLYSAISGTTILPANVENLFLTGTWSTRAIGNAQDNVIAAGTSWAYLDGGAGNDVLIGGSSADTFQIKAGNGSDTIEQFTHGKDIIRIDGYGIGSFASLIANASQVGNDVRIALPNGESLIIRNVGLDTLSAVDFRLADNGVRAQLSGTGDLALSGGTASYSNGLWTVKDNVWNGGTLLDGSDFTIGASVHSANPVAGTVFTWSFPTLPGQPGGGLPVLAYPEVALTSSKVFPIQIGALDGLKVNYDVTLGGDTSGYNASFDIWLKNGTGSGSAITNEVMIWTHQGNLGGAGEPVGTFLDGGFAATIYYNAATHYTSVIANSDTTVGQIDIAKVLMALKNLGIISDSEYLSEIDFGAEVVSGTGSLAINALSYEVTSHGADGTAQTRTVSGTDVITGAPGDTNALSAKSAVAGGSAQIGGTVADDKIIGTAADETLLGYAGNDRLDGGGGHDTLVGGAGNDTYIVHSASDIVVEQAGEGTDIVLSDVSYALTDNVENLTLAGAAALNGTGNALDNVITGNALDNVLDGGAGADTLIGGMGNDTYIVDNANDRVIEAVGGGNDTVITSVSYILRAGQEIETLRTADAAGTTAIHLTGNEFANTIIGNAGDNVIDGGAGADTMSGGAGNDRYYVDNAADKVIEAAGQGTDTVVASVSYALAAGQEIETLQTDNATGTSAINLTGNEFANYIAGNAGDNILDGGAGNDVLVGNGGTDTLIGGAGNDTLYVDSASDRVIEAVGGGTDTVIASVSYALTAGSEIETLRTINAADTAAINLTGNEFANTIIGNAGDNVLDGGAGDDYLEGGAGNDTLLGGAGNDILNGGTGADTMSGGAGNDKYYVDNAADRVIEAAGQGTDTVVASVSYALAAGSEIETLQTDNATGTGAINLTGNEFANYIAGNAGDNVLDGGAGDDILSGGAGNDILIGGAGKDILTGGAGNDTFRFAPGDFGQGSVWDSDRITDFSQGDLIDLKLLASQITGGGGFSFIGNGSFSHTAGEIEAFDNNGNTIIAGDLNGDGVVDFSIRLDGHHTLTKADFVFA